MTAPRLLKGILTGILTGALAVSALPDAETDHADVIVRGTDLEAVAAAVAHHGGTVELEIGLIDAVAADVPVDLVDDLLADSRTLEVSPDASVEVLSRDLNENHRGLTGLEASARIGGAPASQYAGAGIDVAVVDTGIDATALPGTRVVRGVNVSFEPSEQGNAGHGDGYGHGTAMAGIIAGNTRHFQGVARQARLIDVKVADERGVADVSQVLAGIDWVVTNRKTDGRDVRVLSLSFGTDGTNAASTSPLAYAVEAAWRHGIVVVAAAGNHGDALGRLTVPAVSPNIIAVGAADLSAVESHRTLGRTTVPAWSAVGHDRAPDLVAPGRSLLGGRAEGSAVATAHPDAHEGRYLLGSGTSHAAAFTAGVVAAALDADRSLTPDRVKALLVATARPLTSADPARAGAGVLDMGALFPEGRLTQRPVTTSTDRVWSDGTGLLDGDRGRFVLEDADGERLTGERTVVGDFDREAWRSSTWTGSTWTGSTWTGSTWTGSTWTGSTWTGSTWTGSTWTGSTWTGSTWTGSTWTNVRWGE